ncbi:MAG: hypothetical protein FJ148_08995 [Deltaproteobacteria bacterium]|nr:hypothetical protein [Deltaproteobacteria bacterium]
MRSTDSRIKAWATRATVAAALVASIASGAAAQQSGVQQTPDSARYLISKDVGAERWAISYNPRDRTVTGNVFKTDGSPPSFVFCDIVDEALSPNPAEIQYTLNCFGASGCAEAPCSNSQWTLIATGINLPGSFLLPDGTRSTYAGNVQPIFTQSCATNLACHVAGGAGPVNLSDPGSYGAIFRVRSGQNQAENYVTPFDVDGSYLFDKILGTGLGVRMPIGAPPLSAEQTDAIRNWILEGAVNN